LRNEREDLLKIKNMSPDGKLPRGLLLLPSKSLKDELERFKNAI
jgi:hypothetical protein